MHARRIDHEDGSHVIRLGWSHCEIFQLTRCQHRVFGKLAELLVIDHGRDSLLQPGQLQALFDLASRPWWDARLQSLALENESALQPDPESGPAA